MQFSAKFFIIQKVIFYCSYFSTFSKRANKMLNEFKIYSFVWSSSQKLIKIEKHGKQLGSAGGSNAVLFMERVTRTPLTRKVLSRVKAQQLIIIISAKPTNSHENLFLGDERERGARRKLRLNVAQALAPANQFVFVSSAGCTWKYRSARIISSVLLHNQLR